MCLRVKNRVGKRIGKPNAEGFLVGWKLVTEDNKPPMKGCINPDFIYTVGTIDDTHNAEGNYSYPFYNSNNNTFPDNGFLHCGIHLFTSREDARYCRKFLYDRYDDDQGPLKLIKVFYKPEDVVAYGCMNYTGSTTDKIDNLKNVLVKKVTVNH